MLPELPDQGLGKKMCTNRSRNNYTTGERRQALRDRSTKQLWLFHPIISYTPRPSWKRRWTIWLSGWACVLRPVAGTRMGRITRCWRSIRVATWRSSRPIRRYDPGVVVEGVRKRPDGVQLRWRSTKRPEAQDSWPPPGDGLVPFLIEWGEGTPHPAASSAQGARLLELSLFHPRPAEVQPMLSALHIDILVAAGPAPAMRARLETPNGIVTME